MFGKETLWAYIYRENSETSLCHKITCTRTNTCNLPKLHVCSISIVQTDWEKTLVHLRKDSRIQCRIHVVLLICITLSFKSNFILLVYLYKLLFKYFVLLICILCKCILNITILYVNDVQFGLWATIHYEIKWNNETIKAVLCYSRALYER